KIFEHRSIACKHPADLAGVALEPGGALAGGGKEHPDVLLFAWRGLKNVAKSSDFVAGDDPLGRRPFGPGGGNRGCEGESAAGIIVPSHAVALRMPARDMARCASQQCAERAAKRQLAGAGDNAANKAHMIEAAGVNG